MSTLHIVETKTGNLLPDTIERTRAATLPGSMTTRLLLQRAVRRRATWRTAGMYNRHVFYHELGTIRLGTL